MRLIWSHCEQKYGQKLFIQRKNIYVILIHLFFQNHLVLYCSSWNHPVLLAVTTECPVLSLQTSHCQCQNQLQPKHHIPGRDNMQSKRLQVSDHYQLHFAETAETTVQQQQTAVVIVTTATTNITTETSSNNNNHTQINMRVRLVRSY